MKTGGQQIHYSLAIIDPKNEYIVATVRINKTMNPKRV